MPLFRIVLLFIFETSPGQSAPACFLARRYALRCARRPCQRRPLHLVSAPTGSPFSPGPACADAVVAQLVRAPDCGSGGRWFESTQLYQLKLQGNFAPFLRRILPIIPVRVSTGSAVRKNPRGRTQSGTFHSNADHPEIVRRPQQRRLAFDAKALADLCALAVRPFNDITAHQLRYRFHCRGHAPSAVVLREAFFKGARLGWTPRTERGVSMN